MDVTVFALLALFAVLRSALRCGEAIVCACAAAHLERARCGALIVLAETLPPGAIFAERRPDSAEWMIRGSSPFDSGNGLDGGCR